MRRRWPELSAWARNRHRSKHLTPRAICYGGGRSHSPQKHVWWGADHFIDIEQHDRDYMRRWRFEAHMTQAGMPRRWAASTVMLSNSIVSTIHPLVLWISSWR